VKPVTDCLAGRNILKSKRSERLGEASLVLSKVNGKLLSDTERKETLRHARRMEAIGRQTVGIAHDFSNLLANIMIRLELLERCIGPGCTDAMTRHVSIALNSTQRAAALTQRLLAFSRRQRFDPRRIEANRLVRGMEELLRTTVGPRIRLNLTLADRLWPIMCDPSHLENAVLNLATNARDAMPDGGDLTLKVANTYLDGTLSDAKGKAVRPGHYVMISVTDTGSGMTPEVAAQAFEPFFTTKPIGQGTGLGLSMLYDLVGQSDGHVGVSSEPGRGTTFDIYLPSHEKDFLRPAGNLGDKTRDYVAAC
jgi:signal transduction histidine kinase